MVFLCHQQENTLFGDVLILSVRRSGQSTQIGAKLGNELQQNRLACDNDANLGEIVS